MIDENKIAKAARQISENVVNAKGFNDSKPTHLAFLDGHIDGFKQGAKWAINEFLKDLWHPASEKPCEGKYLIVEYNIIDTIKDYLPLKRENGYIGWDWISHCKSSNVTRWLYIDDLLPERRK